MAQKNRAKRSKKESAETRSDLGLSSRNRRDWANVPRSTLILFGITLAIGAIVLANQGLRRPSKPVAKVAPNSDKGQVIPPTPARYFTSGNLTMVWDRIKPEVRNTVIPISSTSNITRSDYIGPQSCEECHKSQYAKWSEHPHRWMNALANDESVLGDFSGQSELRYRGGVARFFKQDQRLLMTFDREDLHRRYEIHQTIGSRFYQYYVGIGLEGPEPENHPYYKEEHVLPFGYWLQRNTWVPIVHVDEELPDGERWESVESVKPVGRTSRQPHEVGQSRGIFDPSAELALTYADSCNPCHTTFPLADMFVRLPSPIGKTLPSRSLFELSQFVAKEHPEIYDGKTEPHTVSGEFLKNMTGTFIDFDARKKAVTLGVSCEACHLGCREHVKTPTLKPAFIPQSPHLLVFENPSRITTGRDSRNVNAICARCHVGERPKYAGGMSTWNSTEYSDAARGSCYSQLSCIDCHDPHQATGKKWSKTPEQDDLSCLKCHQQFADQQRRSSHTHHQSGSTGDRCMNCHMPHINEGIQDVVRTHMIFSPTQPDMLKSNQPNACNLCHLDKSLDWTLEYLRRWYSKSIPDSEFKLARVDRTDPAGVAWLRHTHQPTRLSAVGAFARNQARWGLPHMIPLLNDPYLINRQFAQESLEQLLGISLTEKYGYWYTMDVDERQIAISKMQDDLSKL